jgi:2-polyprenyl-3-methyl-5-hydroxy-6-metoxy-1,4-benzoquinol methylase
VGAPGTKRVEGGVGTSRATTATVILSGFDVAAAMPSVIRDLAVAAYALRSRGIALNVLMLDPNGEEVGADAEQAAARLALDFERIPVTGGAGAAWITGFQRVAEEGRADLVVTLDANGRHDPTEIPRLVDALIERDLHVVIGSRWTRGSGTPGLSMPRWVLGRLANLAFRMLTGVHGIMDATTSFRVVQTDVVRSFDFSGMPVNSHSVQTAFVALAVANGYRVAEAPIIYQPALAGGGGLGLHDVADFLGHLRSLRSSVEHLRARRLAPGGRTFIDEHFGAADDLERLGTANRFFSWVLDEFDSHLLGHVLEVGAGFGTITRKLHDRYPDVRIAAVEPADNMVAELEAFAALSDRVETHHGTLSDLTGSDLFDAVLYLNVLEHIEDDHAELLLAAQRLRRGGALLVFGPAHEWLYSELDYKAGHYRRYTTAHLRRIVEASGLEVQSVRYFDVLGVPPYWLVYRLLGHTDITGGSLWGYDRVVVPLSRLIQQLVPDPPMGKNVIMVARKR